RGGIRWLSGRRTDEAGTYYWFGENKAGATGQGSLARADVIGVSCYSSTDLLHWKNEGIVLPAVPDDSDSDLHPSRVVERPKVLYNERTRSYVMWMHIDAADYRYARTGVAVSKSVTGPYEYLGSIRPNGAQSRDLTVFRDDGGAAYLIHASAGNRTLRIARLSEDYTRPTGDFTRSFVNRYREAPAMFRHDGRYYLITSGCSGWTPNAAQHAVGEAAMGPWRTMGNPCLGTTRQRSTTFRSQSTFVLPVHGLPGAYILMADRWNAADLGTSRYVWLPIE
ncbi:MAG: family 43 glycosylhydrolase, partial [Gemmatimonadales bacterium]|nr:family 43 glycosylhydrolase [Gemmatimonadales bacterium]